MCLGQVRYIEFADYSRLRANAQWRLWDSFDGDLPEAAGPGAVDPKATELTLQHAAAVGMHPDARPALWMHYSGAEELMTHAVCSTTTAYSSLPTVRCSPQSTTHNPQPITHNP